LGGMKADVARGVVLDSAGNVWVTGTTNSTDFPQAAGFPGGTEFVAELSADGTSLLHSQLFPTNTVAAGIAVDANGGVYTAGATGLVSANAPLSVTSTQVYGIANAAGGTLAGRVAAGEVISIYGANLGPAASLSGAFDSTGYLPDTLGGVKVSIGGIPAPLLYVSATQINAIAPVELTGTSPVPLVVTVASAPLPAFRLVIDPAIPAVFQTAAGNAAAINQDGTVNSQGNPAPAGSIVSIWATGVGQWISGADGQEATAAQTECSCEIYAAPISSEPVTGLPVEYAPVLYAGAAPGMVSGVVQINFQVAAYNYYTLTSNGVPGSDFSCG